MILATNHEELYNDICESIRSFFPEEVISLGVDYDLAVNINVVEGMAVAEAVYVYGDDELRHECRLSIDADDPLYIKRYVKRAGKLAVYKLLCKACNIELPWGSLTGIRPTKMIYDGTSEKDLCDLYGVSQQKCDLLTKIINNQREFIDVPRDAFDIYIGIPFCRTRCVYCSFATNDATKSKLIPQYMDALIREIREVASYLNKNGKRPRCIYIGGGTPTALDEDNLEILLNECKAFGAHLEFTVEAGRPDTLNYKKLELIKNAGASRISINPQTMHDKTLKTIGRLHSVDDIVACYEMASDLHFDSINMDMIAGLPGENAEMFAYSLNKIMEIDPTNITVHTLSLKRGSKLSENPALYAMPLEKEVEAMVSLAFSELGRAGYEPYYLYRQKYQSGNLENVGYCRKGTECIYNIDIMEETTSIIALGAGGVSKRVYKDQAKIERCANCKSIYDYIARIDELTAKKLDFFEDMIKSNYNI